MISQIMHLPHLWEIDEAEVTAVCDTQDDPLKVIRKKYNVPYAYKDYHDLLSNKEIDAVILTTPEWYHTKIALDTLEAGKHLFIEKPISITVKDAKRITETAKEKNLTLQIGYNRRYDPSYEASIEKFKEMKEIYLIRAHNSGHAQYDLVNEIYSLYGLRSIFVEPLGGAALQEQLAEQLGPNATNIEKIAYFVLIASAVHIFNALRGIFGDPKRILKTEIWEAAQFKGTPIKLPGILSIMDYGPNCRVVLEQGINNKKYMDEYIEAYSADGKVSLIYDSPFIKNTCTEIRVIKGNGVDRNESKIVKSRVTSYKQELIDFIKCIKEKRTSRTSGDEAVRDMEIFAAVMNNYSTDKIITF